LSTSTSDPDPLSGCINWFSEKVFSAF